MWTLAVQFTVLCMDVEATYFKHHKYLLIDSGHNCTKHLSQ